MLRAQDITEVQDIKGLGIDISKEKKKIVYIVEGIKKETIPGNKRKLVIPFYKNVPAFDQILVEEDGNRNVYNIAFSSGVDPQGNLRPGKIQFSADSAGRIILDPKRMNARTKKLYYYLEATDYNGSKEGRDPSKPVIFRRDNAESNARMSLERKRIINKATDMILNASVDTINKLSVSIGTPALTADSPVDVRRELIINEYCNTAPETIINALEAQTLDTEIMLRNAQKAGLIENIKDKGNPKARFEFMGKTVFEYENILGAKAYKMFAEHLEEKDKAMLAKITEAYEIKEAAGEESYK